MDHQDNSLQFQQFRNLLVVLVGSALPLIFVSSIRTN